MSDLFFEIQLETSQSTVNYYLKQPSLNGPFDCLLVLNGLSHYKVNVSNTCLQIIRSHQILCLILEVDHKYVLSLHLSSTRSGRKCGRLIDITCSEHSSLVCFLNLHLGSDVRTGRNRSFFHQENIPADGIYQDCHRCQM